MNDLAAFSLGASGEEYALRKLHYWLRYEGLTPILGGGAFWLPYSLITTALIILAALFTPYLLWHLAKAKWYRAIAVFITVVCVPFLAALLAETDLSMGFLLSMVPLVCFYLYTWTLRFVIGEQLREAATVRQLEWDRRRRNPY